MKVLVISSTFPPMKSGGADYALRLCQHLADAGAEIHVLTSRIEGIVTDPRLHIYPVMRRWSWSELPRLIDVTRRVRPDVINLHFVSVIYHKHPMVTFIPALLKRLQPGLRFVTHIEAPNGGYLGRRHPVAFTSRLAATALVGFDDTTPEYGTILRDSDRVIVLSDVHRKLLAKHYSGIDSKFVLIPPPPLMLMRDEAGGAARQAGREALCISNDEFLFVYYGYIYLYKGVETLLRAMRIVAQHHPKVRLAMIGGSNEVLLKAAKRPHYVEELQMMAREMGIADNVAWTGYYPTDSDCASLYLRAADAAVLPFDYGVFLNNSSFAAVASHGLPTATTKGEMIEAPFKDNVNVLLCPPKNPEALAAAMVALIEQSELRQRIKTGALDLAQEWFTWDRTVERTLSAFTE